MPIAFDISKTLEYRNDEVREEYSLHYVNNFYRQKHLVVNLVSMNMYHVK